MTLSVKYNSIDDVVIRYAGKIVLVSFFSSILDVTGLVFLITFFRAAETPGASLEVAEDRKFSKHEKNCEEQGISFFPLAVETLGGWSALAIKTLKSVAILADARRSGSRDARVAPVRLLQSLSV